VKRFPLGFLAVVVMLSLGTSIGSAVTTRDAEVLKPQQVEVVGGTAVCPDLRQAKDLLATRVSVGSGPLPAGRTSSGGTIEAHKVTTPSASVPVPVTSSGQVAVGLGTGTTKDGLVVSATGDLAAGLEVEQITRGERGINRGLAGLRCEAPKPEAWFVGGSTLPGNESTLVLANVDDTSATVNITVFTKDGRVDAAAGLGRSVPPHRRLEIAMDTLAPDKDLLAVHVVAQQGRVAAALRHSIRTPTATEGVDWVPQTQPPATTVVVPGFASGKGQRFLYVTNPGTDTTTVSVQVTTQDAQFLPTGGRDAVDIAPGTTKAISLSDLTGTSALSATVTSEGGPVVAGGFSKDYQDGPVREISYTAGALPLSGPALVTDLVIDRPTESTLILSAPGKAATVVVTAVQVIGSSAKTRVKSIPVSVPAGRTAILKLSTFFLPATLAKLAVEVRPVGDSGPVYAARYLRERGAHGPLTTELVLEGPAQLVSRPVVLSDPQVATP
jgi:hypothetical protein